MNIENIKINFLGDSITEGAGASCPENMYVSQIAKKTNSVCNNYGISGTRIAKQKIPSQEINFDRYYNTRVADMERDADLVVVFGGTNDYGHGDAPIGNIDCDDESTFFGAVKQLCGNLINTFPSAHIVFLTPLHRCFEDNLWNENGMRNAGTLSDYCKAIKAVCNLYGLPVIDAYNNFGINPNFEEHKTRFMPDGLHPNDAGHERLADFIIAQLKAL